jgi:O-antigen ligase
VAPFGPFVNKNHFAGYVEMPALLALGLGRGLWRQSASAGQSGVETIRPAVLVAFGAAAVMVMAVLLSLSRGGALGLFAGIATFVIVDITTSRHRRPLTKFVAPVGLGVLLLVILALLPGEVHDRLFGTEWRGDRSALFRFGTWRDALRAFAASPIVGQGLGAFTDILPRYKTAAGAFRVEHPENEVLEIAVEGGLLALGAAATAIVVGLWRVVRQIRGHHDRAARGIVSGAVAAVVALVVHGFVDFNLRIPSNAAMFVAVAALAIAPLGTAPRTGPIRWGVIALLLGAGVLYSRASDAAPVLADARAMAMKAYSPTGDEGRRLRAALADRRAREYVSRRPADPEGWLLAAWTSVMTGQRQNVDALARHAVALDPQRPAVTVAARPFMEVSPAPR